ncbi:hypothetical protein FNW02_17600 [Komarekiella sp. 'clone 1']|uniref:Uncharacterized protein n=1 Tax=Komarekiella delphini-convector SJRDD-AB1 TaxID=2593771 RepID=A0AA40SZ05_9NOST|nr:hypothetical protein [Komarekiella delphini-convector]MBD6617593.1 hypothetical protein [Komarekiella delphini-convector SJRDD-AB1]
MNDYLKLRKSAELLGAICGGLLISLPAIPQAAIAQQSTPKVNPCPRIFYEEPHNSRVIVPQGCPPNAFTQQRQAQGVTSSQEVPSQQVPITTQPVAPEQSVSSPQVPTTTQPPAPEQGVSVSPQVPTRTQSPAPEQGVSVSPPTSQSSIPGQGVLSPQVPTTTQQQAPSTTIALANGRVNVKLVNDTAANVTYEVIGDTAPRSLKGKSDVMLQGLNAPVTVTFQRDDGGLLIATPQSSSEPGMLELRLNEATDVGKDRGTMRIQQNGAVLLN